MPNSKRVVGKSVRYRSLVRPLSNAAGSTSRFGTQATINRSSISHERILSWLAKLCAILLVFLMIAGLYEFFEEDWFFIYQLDVQGLNYLMPGEVERASGVMGYNIFFVEPSAVERSLKGMSEVKSARVMTGIPNLAFVQIEERVPEVLWLKGDNVYWVDSEGIAFKAHEQRLDLPAVRDDDPSEVKMGKRVQPAAFNAFHALHVVWSDAPKDFEWSPSSGLSAIDERGWKIMFGDSSDMEFKVAALQALIPRLVSQGAKIRLIDLGKGVPYYQ